MHAAAITVLAGSRRSNLNMRAAWLEVVGDALGSDLRDLHASSVATGLPVLPVHAVVDDECFHDGHLMRMLDELQECLAGHFDVQHSTIQFEAASHVAHEQGAHR